MEFLTAHVNKLNLSPISGRNGSKNEATVSLGPKIGDSDGKLNTLTLYSP